MKRKIAAVLLFCAAFVLFAVQTIQAIGVVNFHAEFFAKKGTVVIDAGHGGEDGGASGQTGVLEKDINLAIALYLKDYLEQNFFEVILIRDGDYSVGDQSLSTVSQRKRSDMRKRLEMVEDAGDCIFISIHQNYYTESKYSGAQMFFSPNNSDSELLAEAIRSSITSSLQPENHRKNKKAGSDIFLLSNLKVPAVLVECGFLSNPKEEAMLCRDSYQKDMAAAIYNGLIDFLQSKKAE